MNTLKKISLVLIVAFSLALGNVIPAKVASATTTTIPWTRLSGATRYDTMQAIARAGWSNSENVIVASGENFPDALAASSLAGTLDCPILLTSASTLSSQTASTIQSLGAKTVYIVGGTSAVSPAVENQIKNLGCSVARLSGQVRQDTAIAIANQVGSSRSNTCIIAFGNNYPDALSISSYSYKYKAPIYLTEKNGLLSATTLSAIKSAGYNKAIIVGGTAVVSSSVPGQLKGVGVSNTERLAGDTRYTTSRAIANWALGQGMSANNMGLSTGMSGNKFADALAGGAFCGKNNSVVLLTGFTTSAADCGQAAGFVGDNYTSMSRGYVFGGTAVVTDAVANTVYSVSKSDSDTTHTHTWNSGAVTKQATCASAGTKTYTCTTCGATKTETIAKTSTHTWDAGKITREPTYYSEGTKTYTCTTCGATKTESIPKDNVSKYSYEVYSLTNGPIYSMPVHTTYDGSSNYEGQLQNGYAFYIKTDNPGAISTWYDGTTSLVCDVVMRAYDENGEEVNVGVLLGNAGYDSETGKYVSNYDAYNDIVYTNRSISKVENGYILITQFKKAGKFTVKITEEQWSGGKCLYCRNAASFEIEVIDWTEAENAWIDSKIAQYTNDSMNSNQKLAAVAAGLKKEFKYNAWYRFELEDGTTEDTAVFLTSLDGAYFQNYHWDSYVSPTVLCKIAERIGGFDDIHNCYWDNKRGTSKWQATHYLCEVTYQGTKYTYSACPLQETGRLSTIPTVDLNDTSQFLKRY